MVPPALRALEALGPALEAHLQLLLPALVRLICPGATTTAFAVSMCMCGIAVLRV